MCRAPDKSQGVWGCRSFGMAECGSKCEKTGLKIPAQKAL